MRKTKRKTILKQKSQKQKNNIEPKNVKSQMNDRYSYQYKYLK